MDEIYWMTRLDNINELSMSLIIMGSVSLIGFLIAWILIRSTEIEAKVKSDSRTVEEYKDYRNLVEKFIKVIIPTVLICLIVKIFVPTTKEAMLIYGVGGTIDYIKQNPTAKQLPDKCIKALDTWVDSWTINKEDSTENKN